MVGEHLAVRAVVVLFEVQEAADDGQGRAEFVAHVRNEVAAHLFEAAPLGNVARDDHRVARVGGDRRHFENEVRAFGLRHEGSLVVA